MAKSWRAQIVHSLRQYQYEHSHGMVVILLICNVMYYSNHNIWEYAFALPYAHFHYPLDVDMERVVKAKQNHMETGIMPINDPKYPFIMNADRKCRDEDGLDQNIFILIMIKSKLEHFERRRMIRRTWALETAVPYVVMRRVFLLGVDPKDRKLQQKIGLEHQEYDDIIQQFYLDTYFNNTLKIMSGFQWAVEYCPSTQFIVVFDDDYYVNMYNVVKMLQKVKANEYQDTLIGSVWKYASPYRELGTSLTMPLEEYPFKFFPPYPTAGSFFLHMEAVERMHIAMKFTRYIRFDDVYLGIVAHKLRIKLKDHRDLYQKLLPYEKHLYSEILAVHGYGDVEDLFTVWKEQFQLQQARFKNRFQ